jgi:hypothetical protein
MSLPRLLLSPLFIFFITTYALSQNGYWQQHVNYTMDIDFEVASHQYSGTQIIVYTLFLNAFQPNSMMDVRSRTIKDPDSRVGDRIQGLKADEIGYEKVETLTQDGKPTTFTVEGTILEVNLPNPILPGASTTLALTFQAQVPKQIRRTGRDNREGIAYSMAQWYPKLAEYDYQGWHADPYVGREFYGIWGDFDVTIHLDSNYVVAATGYLQPTKPAASAKKTHRFLAPNVHDFLWAADPDYQHTTLTRKDGLELNFYYQDGPATTENWKQLPAIMDRAFDYINANFGQYPYQKYSFIQGGDGGMEYPMGTLITGERPLISLVGVAVHELLHSWYQMVLGTNESLYPWMDEGFTSYASDDVMNYLRSQGLIQGSVEADPHQGDVIGYLNFVKSGMAEPLSTHADHYTTNAAYGVGSYVKGSLFLYQLQYIMGEQAFKTGLLRYFNTWKFRHPTPNDLIRVMEKQANLELDWFREYFVNTNHLPDYAVTGMAEGKGKQTVVQLERIGTMPMPVDVTVTLTNGDQLNYTIPLSMMRGAKVQDGKTTFTLAPDWPWTNPTYELNLDVATKKIARIEVDASNRMLDTNRSNNLLEAENDKDRRK